MAIELASTESQPAGVLRRFFRLAGGFFHPREDRAGLWLVAALLALGIGQVVVQLRLNVWNGHFFDALDKRDTAEFVRQLGIFAAVATASVCVAVLQLNLKMRLQLNWRAWVTRRLIGRWLDRGRLYELSFIEGDHDNPDQRIADDTRLATEIAVDFATGVLNAALMLICFIGVLWALSGPLVIPIGAERVEVPGYMVWAALAYASAGTLLTRLLGRPLARQSADKSACEGDFRYHLVRAKDNAEGIAFMRGEAEERRSLDAAFDRLAAAWRGLRRGTSRLAWLTTGYGLVGMAFPVLVASPMYFAGEISLGGLMQAAAAMVHVQTALSWFVDNFPRIADWKASVGRIEALSVSLDDIDEDVNETDENSISLAEHADATIILHGIDIAYPDGTVVISGANAEIKPGEKVLIVGESGAGKSVLFRAIAGLWPWGRGVIDLPKGGRIVFMPQRPYFPLGSLKAALAYPLPSDAFPDDAYRAVIERCGLEKFVEQLHGEDRWDNVMSGGEQQRLAFARVLLHQPEWVFLDEATSALDEDNQAQMMSLFRQELASTAVISIGHRPGLDAFHDRTMTLVKGDEGARLIKGTRARREQRRAASAQQRAEAENRRRIFGRLRQLARRNWERRAQ